MKKLYKRYYKGTQEKILFCVERFCKTNNLIYTDLQIYDNYVTFIGYSKLPYEELVNQMVRERYTESEEFAILRKAINGITDEYRIYNTYVEDCKAQAKAFIKERNKIVEV